MKKTLTLVLALMLVAVFAMTAIPASAAAVGTAYTIQYSGISLDIDIIDDFSGYTESELTFGDFQYTFGSGKLVLEMPAGGYGWDGPVDMRSSSLGLNGLEDAYNNATYLGLQIKNTGTATAVLAIEDRIEDPLNWATQMWITDGIKLVSANGIADAACSEVTYRGYGVDIPGGFDGWLFIPFSVFKIKQESFNQGEDYPNYLAKFEVPYFVGTAYGDGSAVLEIDNLFLSSAELIVTEPGDEPGGDDPIQGTADISTIAFALAAVVGSGALIIRKKR